MRNLFAKAIDVFGHIRKIFSLRISTVCAHLDFEVSNKTGINLDFLFVVILSMVGVDCGWCDSRDCYRDGCSQSNLRKFLSRRRRLELIWEFAFWWTFLEVYFTSCRFISTITRFLYNRLIISWEIIACIMINHNILNV